MKGTKERGPTLRQSFVIQSGLLADSQAREAKLRREKEALGERLNGLVAQNLDGDRRFRALLWALELAHKENRDLRARLDFLSQPSFERDHVALAVAEGHQ